MGAANKVAINTVIQYARLVLNVVIGLYSVRLILRALGTDDYGIYDVVAGVIALISFINATLTQTSIRFISVSLGGGNVANIKKTFSNCFWLHMIIASALVFIMELLGYFLFDGFLNIPENRLISAKIVYHCMVITTFLQVFVTPLNAVVVAHEKFLFTAIVSILDSFLKLFVALYLSYSVFDKLITYGSLVMLITLFNVFLYTIYVIKKYRTEVSVGKFAIKNLKSVIGFAGWTILDVLGTLTTRQGYSILINKYFGTSMNAVFAIGRQVEGQLYGISAAVIDTMKPQIMKSYGEGEDARMLRLSMTAGKFGYSLMCLIAIPLITMMPQILSLWLGDVPDGTVLFTRLLIIACMLEQLTRGLVYACQATGNIKWFSITISTIRIMALPLSWFSYALGAPAYTAIVIFVICEGLGSFMRVIVMSKITGLSKNVFLKDVILRLLPTTALFFATCVALAPFADGISGIIINSLISCVIFLFGLYFLGLSIDEKYAVQNISRVFINRFKK